jgi:heme exporter protein B
MSLVKEIKHLIIKEAQLELRSKYALSSILLYLVSTVFISYLAFKSITNPVIWNALFWIIMVFAAINAISKSFIQENSGRLLYYYTLASPQAIILSKIIYNIILMAFLSLACFGFYSLFIGNNIVQDIPLFLLVLFLGSSGFSGILTMTSAIASKTQSNFALMAVLSFPLLVPLLLALMKVSKNAVDGLAHSVSYPYLWSLGLINIMVIVLSYLLFPYLWRD